MDIKQISAGPRPLWTVNVDQSQIMTTDELRARCGFVPPGRPAPALPPPSCEHRTATTPAAARSSP